MPINISGPAGGPGWSLGAIIAVIILVVCIVLAILGEPLKPIVVLGCIAALALARLT